MKRWILEQVWVTGKVTQMLLIKQNMKNNYLVKWKIWMNKMKTKKTNNKISQMMKKTKWIWKMILMAKINKNKMKMDKKMIKKMKKIQTKTLKILIKKI